MLNRKIVESESSPIPLLYLDRIFKLLTYKAPAEKIRDVGRPPLPAAPLYRTMVMNPDVPMEKAARSINGTRLTAYVDNLGFAEMLVQFHRSLPSLLDPRVRRQTREREQIYRVPFLTDSRTITEKGMLQLLQRGGPQSRDAYRAIARHRQVDLIIHSPEAWERIYPKAKHGDHVGYFIPDHRSSTGRTQIIIKGLDPRVSLAKRIEGSFEMEKHVVHEYEHFRHEAELDYYDNPTEKVYSEMRAFLSNGLVDIRTGDNRFWREAGVRDPRDYPLHLRTQLERMYIDLPFKLPKRGK